MRITGLLLGLATLTLIASCANSVADSAATKPQPATHPGLAALPVDELQPGERTDSAGYVIAVTARRSSQLPIDAPFAAGSESFAASSDVTDDGAAATLSAPANGVSYTL